MKTAEDLQAGTGNLHRQIGVRVNSLMFERRTTQTRLAPQLGLTQPALSKKLHGDRRWDAEELVAIADLFDVDLDDLCGRTPNSRTPDGGPAATWAPWDSNPQPADVRSELRLVA